MRQLKTSVCVRWVWRSALPYLCLDVVTNSQGKICWAVLLKAEGGLSLNSPLPSVFLIHHLPPLPPAPPCFLPPPPPVYSPFNVHKIPPSRACSFKVALQTSIWIPRLTAIFRAFQHQSLYPELFLWSFFSYRKWNLRVCIASSLQRLFPLRAFQLFPSLSVSEPESFLTMQTLESVFPVLAAEWV